MHKHFSGIYYTYHTVRKICEWMRMKTARQSTHTHSQWRKKQRIRFDTNAIDVARIEEGEKKSNHPPFIDFTNSFIHSVDVPQIERLMNRMSE